MICTQGKVIPDLIAWWCERDGIRPDKSRNRKGSTWVLSLADGHLIAADHIGSALATNVPSLAHRFAAERLDRAGSAANLCLMRSAPTGGRAWLAAFLAGAFLAGGPSSLPFWRGPSSRLW